MSAGTVAAVDLGATSGRVILGRVDGRAGTLELDQVARFPNGPVRLASGLHWDFTGLYRDVTRGLADAFRRDPAVASRGMALTTLWTTLGSLVTYSLMSAVLVVLLVVA